MPRVAVTLERSEGLQTPLAAALTSFTIFFSMMGLAPRRTAEQVTSTLPGGG